MSDAAPEDDGERRAGGMASAGASALVARIVAQGAQLGMFIIAARILTPADFGVFALVAAVSSFLFVLGAAGWREFILGWGGEDRAVNQAITYSFLAGYAMTAVGVSCAAVAVLHFKAPLVAVLILTLSASLFLAPVSHTLGAILVRRGAVASLSFVMIIAELCGLAAGALGLLAGWNIVALGVSKLAMQFVTLIGVMLFARWPIKLVINGGFRSEIVDVSRSILASRVVGFISANASTFIVGAFLGVTSVGYFRAAERVVSAISEMLFEPLRLISWMVFRQAADRAPNAAGVRDSLVEESRLVFPLMMLFAAPVFIGAAIVSDDLVAVLLGEKWLPAAPVVTILALGGLMMTPSVVSEPLLTINGKVKHLPAVTLFNAIVTVTVFFTFTHFGLMAAAYARLAASVAVLVSSIWVQSRHAAAPWWSVAKKAGPVYTGVIALVITVFITDIVLADRAMSAMMQLGVEVVAGAVVYFSVVYLVRPSFLRTTFWL